MKKALLTVLTLLPFFALGQEFPTEQLKKNGVTQEEIDLTHALNGKNGVNGYFLVRRQVNMSTNPDVEYYNYFFSLYTPEGKLITLWDDKPNDFEVDFFEFVGDEIVIIEKKFIMRKVLRITRYSIPDGKLVRAIDAVVPCRFGNECDWIKYEKKQMAFFTNLCLNEGLEQNSVYEYNWRTGEIRLVYGEVTPFTIDAVTGNNLSLSDVNYNEETGEFEYVQE